MPDRPGPTVGESDQEPAGPNDSARGPVGWGAAELVAASRAYSLVLALNDRGDAVVAWDGPRDEERLGGWGSVFRASTGTWNAPTPLDADSSPLDLAMPTVGIDDDGNAFALWQAQNLDWTQVEVWGNRFDAQAAAWDGPQQISGQGLSGFPQLAVSADGSATAVFGLVDIVTVRASLAASAYDPTTNHWGAAQAIGAPGGGFIGRPRVASNASGEMLAVWADGDFFGSQPFAQRYSAATASWLDTTELGEVATIPMVTAVGMNDAGSAITAWPEGENVGNAIRANRYDGLSGRWGGATTLGTGGAGVLHAVLADIDRAGNVIAVWNNETLDGQSVWSNRYDAAANAWTGAQRISPDDNLYSRLPQIGMDAQGNAFVAWSELSRERTGIRVTRYDAAEQTWDAVYAIDTAGQANAIEPQLAVTSDGRAMVAWMAEEQGIYVNQYYPPSPGGP